MRRMPGFAAILSALFLFVGSLWAHEHKPPHKGTLVEFGEEFAHLELVLDAKEGQLTAYALDGEAENAVRLSQKDIQIKIVGSDKPLTLKGIASPLSGEKEGDTSQFEVVDEQLKGKTNFDGLVIAINIKGKDFKDVKFNFPKGNEDAK